MAHLGTVNTAATHRRLTWLCAVLRGQGSNHESYDRKGWDTSIQAYHEFYRESLNAGRKVFLYIHAIPTRAIIEHDMGRVVGQQVVNTGQNLVLLLRTVGLPEDAYTLDERIHPIAEAMALKRMADVCMHPSKVEGFGLNVLECQKLGTPVITTKFFAMYVLVLTPVNGCAELCSDPRRSPHPDPAFVPSTARTCAADPPGLCPLCACPWPFACSGCWRVYAVRCRRWS